MSSKTNDKIYRTGLYYRISKDDGDKSESDSISNQRILLKDYVDRKEEFQVVDEYIDDGYSGSNFERPAFKRLYEDIQSGAVNCIIVKDLSRFGRNYIEVGRYLEHIFPLMGVRLIAVNDNYDGESTRRNSDSLTVPISNLMNDVYCREMSLKIRRLLEAGRKRGDCVSNYAPYGYRKSSINRLRLVIDESAAENVRSIYEWKLDGMSNQGIAEKLNKLGIPSPLEHRIIKGERVSQNFKRRNQAVWSSGSVERILRNEVYTGVLVQGRRQRLDYRSKKIVGRPENEWIRVENVHEALIDKSLFDIVQRLMQRNTRTVSGKDKVSLFSGYVVCGDCGNNMVLRSSGSSCKKYKYFICSAYKKNHSCSAHNIGFNRVYDAVLNAVRQHTSPMSYAADLLRENDCIFNNQNRLEQMDLRMNALVSEIERLKRIRRNLYSDYMEGILSWDDYIEYTSHYSQRIDDMQNVSEEILRQRLSDLNESSDSRWASALKKYHNVSSLTRPMVAELINEIRVFDDGSISVIFNDEDIFLDTMREMPRMKGAVGCGYYG